MGKNFKRYLGQCRNHNAWCRKCPTLAWRHVSKRCGIWSNLDGGLLELCMLLQCEDCLRAPVLWVPNTDTIRRLDVLRFIWHVKLQSHPVYPTHLSMSLDPRSDYCACHNCCDMTVVRIFWALVHWKRAWFRIRSFGIVQFFTASATWQYLEFLLSFKISNLLQCIVWPEKYA